MPIVNFENDLSSRKATRILLFTQIATMIIVVGSIAFHLYSFALVLSIIMFITFIAVLVWLYFRYRNIPVVQEKLDLQNRTVKLRNSIQVENNNLQLAKQKRDGFFQAEQSEIDNTLSGLQQDHVDSSLKCNFEGG